MTQHFTTADGVRLAYDVQGAGQPLLCLSGLTRNMADFDYLLPHLSGVQIIRMDYRGRGASDRARTSTYNVLHEAQDVVALLNHLGLARTAVLGTSRGGLVGHTVALLAGPVVTGLCFNDIGPVIERAGLARIAAYVGKKPAAQTLADHAGHLAKASPGFAKVPPQRWLDEARHQLRETPDGLQLSYDPALRKGVLDGLKAPPADLWPLFDALAALPLAAIRGANSDILSAATLAEMQRRRPDMITATVPDRGHVPFLDEPESLAVLHAFLKTLPSPTSPCPTTP